MVAVFVETNEAGIEVVVCNNKGEMLAALSIKIALLATVDLLETLFAKRACQFFVELGLHQSIFKGDFEVAMKAPSRGVPTLSRHIVKDIMLTGSLRTHSFSHVRLQGNFLSHALARRARSSYSLLVWMENVPPNISVFISFDFLVT